MFPLTNEDRQLLLRLARQALETHLENRQPTAPVPDRSRISSLIEAQAGVFVTLHKDGEVRGCVGLLESRLPLYRAVMEAAASAAFEDPRFFPVRAAELAGLEIEISVLSPCQPILPEEIQIGVHGLVVSRGRARGLLLPQVAVERHWGPEQFLEETCRKAGLTLDALRTGARLEAFRAQVFGENSAAVVNCHR